MKNFKYFLIFIALFAACASNLGAMDDKMIEKIADDKTGVPSLDITAINQKLDTIKINDGFLCIQADNETTLIKGFSSERTIRLMHVKKSREDIEIGRIHYVISHGPLGYILIGTLSIKNKKYRKRKLATIITLAGLQQVFKDSVKNNVTVVAAHEATHKIFKGIGFKPTATSEDILETDCLPKLLAKNGPRMMQAALEAFEQSTHCCGCSLIKLLCLPKNSGVRPS